MLNFESWAKGREQRERPAPAGAYTAVFWMPGFAKTAAVKFRH